MAIHKETISRLLRENKKAATVNIIILANAFIWYSYGFDYLLTAIKVAGIQSQFLPIISVHFLGLFLALIIGQFVNSKIKHRISFLLWWMVAGVFLSLLPLVTGMGYTGIILFSIITGVNFGFGIPASLSFFSSTTEANRRGKMGGILFLLIGIGSFTIGYVGTQSFVTIAIVLSIWRAIGCLFLILLKPENQIPVQQPMSYKNVLANRSFLLYFIPWTMFLLVNSLAFPVIQTRFPSDLVSFSSEIEFILGGLSGLIFGFLADTKGRKRLTIIGFALLGFGYAILSFTSGNIVGWWIYTFIDGTAWGAFVMIFVFTIWGDLAEGRNSEKLYAIGLMPYLFSTFIRYSIGSFLASTVVDFAAIFSYLTLFLFIAVLPLVFAPETLSEQIMKNTDLQSYIKKATKKVAKNQIKFDKEEEPKISVTEPHEEQDDYEKARELAEKYY